jgi:hypothetical protein
LEEKNTTVVVGSLLRTGDGVSKSFSLFLRDLKVEADLGAEVK